MLMRNLSGALRLRVQDTMVDYRDDESVDDVDLTTRKLK